MSRHCRYCLSALSTSRVYCDSACQAAERKRRWEIKASHFRLGEACAVIQKRITALERLAAKNAMDGKFAGADSKRIRAETLRQAIADIRIFAMGDAP